MDDFETENISYAILRLEEGHEPADCIENLEAILGEYGFHGRVTFARGSKNPGVVYASDEQGAIFVSYGCQDLRVGSLGKINQVAEMVTDNSVFIMPLSVEDYIFQQIMRDFNNGEDYEELELEDGEVKEGGDYDEEREEDID